MNGRRVAWAGCSVLLVLGGCVSISSENVKYGPGRGSYPGYSVEYVEATPSPGSVLTAGSRVNLSVTVRYSLMLEDKGRVQLQFEDQKGQALLAGNEASVDVARAGSGKVTVSREVTVPSGIWDLVACVYVVPEGARGSSGELRIRYAVAEPK